MNEFLKRHYLTIAGCIEESERNLLAYDKQKAKIWEEQELTNEAKQKRVDALLDRMNTKRTELHAAACNAFEALREHETAVRIADAQAVNAAFNTISWGARLCNKATLSALLVPLKGQHDVFEALIELCNKKEVSHAAQDAFRELMYCKHDEHHSGTPISPAEYYAEAKKYIDNYFGFNVEGRVIPQTIIWIPTWVPRVDPTMVMQVLNEIAKVGEFEPIEINHNDPVNGVSVCWPVVKSYHYPAGE